MSYSGQMRVAAAQIKLQLELRDSNWVRFAWLGAKAFESATAVLFSAVVNGGQTSNQFIAHGCYLKTSLEMIKAFENTKEIWESWPLKLTRFGQYHFSGQSALDLAIKFANGMGTEVALARLKAYPGQAIEGRELGELTEWQTQFRWELNERRSELAEMPNWALHQERDTVLDGIKNELVVALENTCDKQRAEAVARLSKPDSTERESENKTSWNKLSNCEQVRLTKNRIFGFFRRWERKPNESDLSEFNSYFGCGRAAPHFDQEFDDLLWLVRQVLNIARAKQLPIQSTNRFHGMLCHYDIEAACTLRYDVSAELTEMILNLVSDTPNAPLPPPNFDATSKDWIFGNVLAEKLNLTTKTMSDYRKQAEFQDTDLQGRWGVDAIGTFRRKVNGTRNVAYYLPALKPSYQSRLAHTKQN